MADTITLDILTPRGPIREGASVPGVQVPGITGELGLLPHHEPLLTALVPGVLRFREGESVRIAVGRGFAEVRGGGRVVILVDQAMDADRIDVEAVRDELRGVESELRALAHEPPDAPPVKVLVERRRWLEAQLHACAH